MKSYSQTKESKLPSLSVKTRLMLRIARWVSRREMLIKRGEQDNKEGKESVRKEKQS